VLMGSADLRGEICIEGARHLQHFGQILLDFDCAWHPYCYYLVPGLAPLQCLM
jgi:hypothetical protein